MVWQPEDIFLVRDLLELEHEPLNEVLVVDALRADDEINDDEEENKVVTNTNITAMGRPINTHPHIRWKLPVELKKGDIDSVEEVIPK